MPVIMIAVNAATNAAMYGRIRMPATPSVSTAAPGSNDRKPPKSVPSPGQPSTSAAPVPIAAAAAVAGPLPNRGATQVATAAAVVSAQTANTAKVMLPKP